MDFPAFEKVPFRVMKGTDASIPEFPETKVLKVDLEIEASVPITERGTHGC